mgnify:CR=1 FL=1
MSISFPWQSWSPVKHSLFRMPRDYCPVVEVAPENKKPANFKLKSKIFGWCSWHTFGTHINKKNILEQLKKIKKEYPKVKYILIDDGWCKWGDWQDPFRHKFFNGLSSISKHIKKNNFKIGLWFAPFLVSPDSKLALEHGDWLVKDKKGRLVEGMQATFLDKFLPWKKYILNYELPEVKEYIKHTLDIMVTNWQVDLLKLDFLYAPYFDPKLKDDKLPNSYLRDIFVYLKKKYPHVYIMACGCPYKPAKYLVDSIRISCDITIPQLYNIPFLAKFIHKKSLNQLQKNWESLQPLAKYFNLDPDAFLPQNITKFNYKEHGLYSKIILESKVFFYG